MKRPGFSLAFAVAVVAALGGCATHRHSATLGNYKVVYGEMNPVAYRWEKVKAAVAGWEVVADSEDEECSVLLLHKPE